MHQLDGCCRHHAHFRHGPKILPVGHIHESSSGRQRHPGAPGLRSWAMISPARFSAWCIVTHPARVTGAVAPSMGQSHYAQRQSRLDYHEKSFHDLLRKIQGTNRGYFNVDRGSGPATPGLSRQPGGASPAWAGSSSGLLAQSRRGLPVLISICFSWWAVADCGGTSRGKTGDTRSMKFKASDSRAEIGHVLYGTIPP